MTVVYAGFWRRFWALVIDVVFLACVVGLMATGFGDAAMPAVPLVLVVYFVVTTMTGGSVGKRMLALRVVRSDGSRVDVLRAFVRDVVIAPLSFLAFGIGVLWMLDGARRQTWHDIVADTVVVRELVGAVSPSWSDDPPWRRESTA